VAILRPKTTADGLMPEDAAAAIDWWTHRILTALRAGAKTVTRPPNSKRIVEMLAMSAALRAWRGASPERETSNPEENNSCQN